MNDDELRRALRTLERVQPPEGVADALFERLLDELAEERVSRPAPLPRRRRLRWLQGRPVIAFGVALALLIGAAVVVLVPRPRTALAVLQEARQRFEDLPPYHATTVVRANDDASDPDFETTWETEDWHASVRRWRTLFTSGDLSFTGGPGSYRVFDGTLVGDFHAEANVFTVMPFEDLDQELEQASPSFFFNPSLQYWSTGEEGVAGKPTDQFFEEDCTATPGRFIGRAATAIHCEAKPSDLEVWVDDETGMLLRIQWFDVIREIRTIEFRPEFPAGIFEVVPPEGAKKRWGGKGPAPPDYETAVGDEVAARYQVAQPPLGGLPVLAATAKGIWVSPIRQRAENEPYRTSLVRVDPRSGKVLATLDAPLYDFVNAAAEVGDSLWVYLSERPRGDDSPQPWRSVLRRVDLATNRFVDPPLEVGRGIGGGMIVEGGIAWLVGAQTRHVVVGPAESDYVSLTQVVLADGAIRHLELDGWSSGGPALADGYLWVGLQKIDERNPREILSSIVKIDPRTLKMVAKIDVPSLGGALVGSSGAVYATVYPGGGDLRPRVMRIDTATLATKEAVLPPESGLLQIGGGSLWALNFLGNEVMKLDPSTLEIRARIPTGDRPGGMRAGAGSLWVAHSGDGTLARIDLE